MHAQLYFLRTEHQSEVDLIIDYTNYKEWIEIKHNSTFKPQMLKSIQNFIQPSDKGILVYCGPTQDYDHNLERVNYEDFLQRN